MWTSDEGKQRESEEGNSMIFQNCFIQVNFFSARATRTRRWLNSFLLTNSIVELWAVEQHNGRSGEEWNQMTTLSANNFIISCRIFAGLGKSCVEDYLNFALCSSVCVCSTYSSRPHHTQNWSLIFPDSREKIIFTFLADRKSLQNILEETLKFVLDTLTDDTSEDLLSQLEAHRQIQHVRRA